MSKIKEVMLLAVVADGSIEIRIADAGKVVNAIYVASPTGLRKKLPKR